MKYGFVIDNRKCIGCHACTTACKSEHDVAVGVNRTWVKQVEKGEFPEVRRFFSVMRCNHCTDAPCVSICPTEALYIRKDGIVDFDNDRCIGCKSCMQACPYDALYIDPDTHTAAKCNYCAHRVDVGLEPACVNVCPEEAIISGDIEDPESNIFKLLQKHSVKTRKPEKGTDPNVFYIDADDVSLVPHTTEKHSETLWGDQERGVGHYVKAAEKMALSNQEVTTTLETTQQKLNGPKTVEVLMTKGKRVYDAPDKGILWGWEVSAYVWTKALSAGTFLVMFLGWFTGDLQLDTLSAWIGIGASLGFLALTGALLVKDLDRPDRFLYVLLRPHWNSWLVRGGYAITFFGAFVSLVAFSVYMQWEILTIIGMYVAMILALIVAVYTAFLFAQAKGRDFWQSPSLAIHMLNHAVMAGASAFLIIGFFQTEIAAWVPTLEIVLGITLLIHLTTTAFEIITPHPTTDAKRTVELIVRGPYKQLFWWGAIILGGILPLACLFMGTDFTGIEPLTGILSLIGIYITEKIWVEAPQNIPLS